MTKQNFIRILSGLMFLIFFCPFFQMCSDENLKDVPFGMTNGEYLSMDGHGTPPIIHKIPKSKDIYIVSGYKLAYQTFAMYGKDFSGGMRDPIFYACLCFTFTLIFCLALLAFALKGRFKTAGIIGGVVVFLNVIALVIVSVDQVLEDISQIKYGYYLFAINLIIIISLCAKLKIKTLRDGIDW